MLIPFPLWHENFCIIYELKHIIMPNEKTDKKGFASSEADQERDMAAKGGPSTSLGKADDKHRIVKPYNEDLQTQSAAKSKHRKDDNANRKKNK
jgi:hypothetical protein